MYIYIRKQKGSTNKTFKLKPEDQGPRILVMRHYQYWEETEREKKPTQVIAYVSEMFLLGSLKSFYRSMHLYRAASIVAGMNEWTREGEKGHTHTHTQTQKEGANLT